MRFSLLVLIVAALLYPATAAAADCPAGYQQLASGGTDFGCIETAQHAPANLFTAEDTCFALGGRLPNWTEFRAAFLNLSLSTEPGLNVKEWLTNPDPLTNNNLLVNTNDPSNPETSFLRTETSV